MIEITDLSECEQFSDTTILLFNRSSVPVTVDTVLTTRGVEFRPSQSITIQPGGSESVLLRFRPQQAGQVTEQVTLVVGPCGDSVTITVQGIKQGIVLGFDEESIAFPTVLTCGIASGFDATATLHNTGNSPNRATITSARLLGNTAFSIGENIIGREVASSGRIPIPVRFDPDAAGDYSGLIELVLAPCGDTLRLPLAASVVEARLTVEGGVFNPTGVGIDIDTVLVIRNPLPVAVRIDSIEPLIAPFILLGTDRTIPTMLAAGDSIVLRLRFAPTFEGTFSQTSTARVSDPCAFAITLPLAGIATPRQTDPVLFCIDDRPSGLAGDTVAIRLRGTQQTLEGSSTIDYIIRYDARRLELIVDEDDSIELVDDDRIEGVAHLRQIGVTAVELRQLNLRFHLLVGPEEEAIVRLDSVAINGDSSLAIVCGDSAVIRITDRCIYTSLTFGKYRNLLGDATPNPAATTVELTYQQLESVRAIIRVWDINGREVLRPLDEELPGGRYTVRFSVSELPSGRYFYGIEAGMYREVKGLVIER
jgi:hypothetical protein